MKKLKIRIEESIKIYIINKLFNNIDTKIQLDDIIDLCLNIDDQINTIISTINENFSICNFYVDEDIYENVSIEKMLKTMLKPSNLFCYKEFGIIIKY
jgi:hypothetical protein